MAKKVKATVKTATSTKSVKPVFRDKSPGFLTDKIVATKKIKKK